MHPTPDTDALLLPEGTRLLHIGPHKTGTTAVQAALWSARASLLEQGVRHVGRSRNPSNAVRAVTEQSSPYSEGTPPSMRHWRDLVREIRGAKEPRLVVSSEFFAWARPEVIRHIVDELDPARVRIAVTVRPLARLIPSHWQQNIQAGTVVPLEAWIETLFREPPGRPNPSFWWLQRHDELIARWAEVAGPERVTAVVVDDRAHDVVLRAFERLLGLRDGTLVGVRDLANRSLTLPEAEAVRAFNVRFKAEGLPKALHARLMRFGAAQVMKQREPAADEPRVELPPQARDRVAAAARGIVAGIEASGVRVIGDLSILAEVPAPRPDAAVPAGPVAIPPDVAAAMAMGIVASTGAARDAGARTPFKFAEPVELVRVPTYQVIGVVGLRTQAVVLRGHRRIGRVFRRG
jgi:hypothetical protein